MDDQEKIKAAVTMLKRLKRMVGFFMKKDISELIEKLESKEQIPHNTISKNFQS